MATAAGTRTYRGRFVDDFGRAYFRRFGDCVVSSIGAGTYLGDPTDEADNRYREALVAALESGINVIDTAINYRCQRSERSVGRAVADANVSRDATVIATKGGFLPFDGERPADPGAYIRSEFIESGRVDPDDLARGIHCIAPEYIDDQLDRSLDNLGVRTIDLYYIHNPETQLATRSREAVYDQLEATFTRLEERGADGDITWYGVATWDAFRVPAGGDRHLSLPEVTSRARAAADAAGNETTRFRAVQLPFNVLMADAFTVEAHEGAAGVQSALAFARDAGLDVFTSASIAQGQLADPDAAPESVSTRLDGETPAQRAINFARSAPGVTCALVGMASSTHVAENVAAGAFDPMGADTFDATFE